MKIFIGGSLTNAKQDLFKVYQTLDEYFKEAKIDTYNPSALYHEYKSQDVSNQFAFSNCLKQFKTCTHAVMYIGTPSLGVGIELTMLHMLQVPTIAYWFSGDKVSDYALGFLERSADAVTLGVDTIEQLKDHVVFTWWGIS